jgi:hypothetical protein
MRRLFALTMLAGLLAGAFALLTAAGMSAAARTSPATAETNIYLPVVANMRASTTGDVALLGCNEPHTAVVNPLNPHNIAVSACSRVRISTDFGVTFLPTVIAALPPGLPAGYGLCGDDSLGFDAAGRLFWTYLICADFPPADGNRDDISVAIQQVNPTTGAFIGNAVDVTPGNHSDDKQWLAVDANPASPFANNIYLHWTRFDKRSRAPRTRAPLSRRPRLSRPAAVRGSATNRISRSRPMGMSMPLITRSHVELRMKAGSSFYATVPAA